MEILSLGDKVKELRLKKGWTQKDLADKIERKQNTISYIEKGGGAESDTIKALAEALGVSVDYLINEEKTAFSEDELKDTEEFEFALNLIKAVLNDKNMRSPEDLDEDKMKYIERILKTALEKKSNK